MYEQKGLLRPRKSIKNTRLYSQEDVDLGRYIQRLTQEMGMNLAGVSKVLDLERQVAGLERENRALREELERKELEHSRLIAEVHRSYKRELVLMPRSELGAERKEGPLSDRAHALLQASEAGDPRLMRHVRASHLHRVHGGHRRRDKVPRRCQAATRRAGRRHEDQPTPQDHPRRRRASPSQASPWRGALPPPTYLVALRRGRLRGGNPDQPRRRPQRRACRDRISVLATAVPFLVVLAPDLLAGDLNPYPLIAMVIAAIAAGVANRRN